MAHHPIWRPDSTKPVQSGPVPDPALPEAAPASSSSSEGNSAGERQESDVAQWAAKFAAHGGGKIPAELSGELALDIVLNEVVEQAWLTTGATGSAIALVRDGEMVCRASGGVNAPELGTRLDTNSGLSGACVRTRQIQCCDDAFTDPGADKEASRQLGMRSVVVLPLLLDGELIGIFEIFSPRAFAFGDRDLQTLGALAQRVLRNTKARQSSLVSIALTAPSFVSATPEEDASVRSATEKTEGKEEPRETGAAPPDLASASIYDSPIPPDAGATGGEVEPERRFDWVTSVMGGIVVAVALLMTLVFAVRVGWLKTSGQRRPPRLAGTMSSSVKPATSGARQEKASANVPTPGNPQKQNTAAPTALHAESGRAAEGGLRVYENGKEIFRMPPSGVEMPTDQARATEKDANADATLKSAGILELAPGAAEGSVVRRVEPQYPEQALAQRVQGPVVLDVHIGPQGEVTELKVVSGDALLVDAAVAAVRQWRFKPRAVNGRAVDLQTQITLKFTLPPS
jgi:TonB family protein